MLQKNFLTINFRHATLFSPLARNYSPKNIHYRGSKCAKITCHSNYQGILKNILQKISDAEIELLYIESKVNNRCADARESIDFWCSYTEPKDPARYDTLVHHLNAMNVNISDVPPPRVPAFPMDLNDLDDMQQIKLESETVDPEDPMYIDMEYRERRKFLES
jgi:hypothetical protein